MPRPKRNETPEERTGRIRIYTRTYYAKNKAAILARRRSRMSDPRHCAPGEGRAWQLMSKFGITVNRYDELLQSQGGGCAICGALKSKDGRRLAVDHCHATGRIRGLLCTHCNVAIGMLKDSVESANRIVIYLSKYQISDSYRTW